MSQDPKTTRCFLSPPPVLPLSFSRLTPAVSMGCASAHRLEAGAWLMWALLKARGQLLAVRPQHRVKGFGDSC